MLNEISRDSACPCKSGKKFGECCLVNPIDYGFGKNLRGHKIRTVHERNLIFLEAIGEIFGFAKGNSWGEIKRNITSDQVRELYTVVATIWPKDTDVEALLAGPEDKLRAQYLGAARPELVLQNIFRFSLYADQILILDPFHNPWSMTPEFNPIHAPDQYREETLRLVLFTSLLKPWIEADLVQLIPDPNDFLPGFRQETWALAKARLAGYKPAKDEIAYMEQFAKADWERSLLAQPADHLAQMCRTQGVPSEKIPALLEYAKRRLREDPLAVESPLDGQLMTMDSGGNLETNIFMSHLSGAFPYTDHPGKWRELNRSGKRLPDIARTWTPLTKAFAAVDFRFLNNVTPEFACALRQDGRLESFRAYLRRVYRSVRDESESPGGNALALAFGDELKDEFRKAEAEYATIDRDLLKDTGAKIFKGAIALLHGHLGFFAGVEACAESVLGLLTAHSRRKDFKRTVPMSVFLDLSKMGKT
jgi:hypothetical protein